MHRSPKSKDSLLLIFSDIQRNISLLKNNLLVLLQLLQAAVAILNVPSNLFGICFLGTIMKVYKKGRKERSNRDDSET